MSSYLDGKSASFQKGLKNSGQLTGVKRTLVAQGSTPARTSPSPIPSSSNDPPPTKKRPQSDIVYSQPADTGSGFDVRTQVHYAVDYLKSREEGGWLTLGDLILHLSLQHKGRDEQLRFKQFLLANPRVEYDASGAEGGQYRFRPIHNVRNAEDLLRVLQSQTTAAGLNARELRDGWKNSESVISDLERRHKLLVTRNKKDNHARMVWADDPTLRAQIEPDFQTMWHSFRLPAQDLLLKELEKAKITPTSKSNSVLKKAKAPEKKVKKPRRGGKVTNTHMQSVLRDYSSLARAKADANRR